MVDPNTLPEEEGTVVASTPEEDLDSWYDEVDNEDLSADEEDDPEGTSPPEDDPPPSPHPQAQPLAAQAVGDGSSPAQTAQDDPYGWVHELDPDLKAKVESLVHRDQSQRGRVAALQSRLDKLTAEQEARARLATTPAAPRAVVGGKAVEDMDDTELQEFMEQFPSVARNVQKLVAKEREEILDQVRPIQQEALQNRLAAQKEQLRYNAQHIFNTAETGVDLDDVMRSPRFKEWFADQPTGYQKFARTAESVEDATKVLTDFAQWTDEQVYMEWAASQTRGEGQQQNHASQGTRQTADQTAARRKAALQGSSPKSRSAEIGNSPYGDDYEAYFNEAVDKG